ncbi:AzlC family ABC transporter permease [Kushneria aurantia]|uniref:AzlC family ABC transporter permease n=1 Tax=Kushneria aurantia TaxID=504092 RepID=A0ABV6G5Y9_9GAMM|nr:AzlC family ABC transporter permease [Kushneria aurantia]
MTTTATAPAGWRSGLRDTLPLLGGYLPVAISFGVIASRAGFSPLEVGLISALIYAGASQFLFVGMAAAGAPLWLTVVMTLVINLRHLAYAPNLAEWLPRSRSWPWLMHGLTDQVFALAHARLPQLESERRLGWFAAASLLAWLVWIGGSLLGALAGEWLTARWPLLDRVMPFALPALFLVLVAPRFTSLRWSAALTVSTVAGLVLTLTGPADFAIVLAAACGMLCFYLLPAVSGRYS